MEALLRWEGSVRVFAEGAETEPRLVFVRERGCDEVQGFLLGIPAAELPA